MQPTLKELFVNISEEVNEYKAKATTQLIFDIRKAMINFHEETGFNITKN